MAENLEYSIQGSWVNENGDHLYTSGRKDGGNGTNSSGFTGLPAGYRLYGGAFFSIGVLGGFWSSTEEDAGGAGLRSLGYGNSEVYRGSSGKGSAFSCRCVRD